MENIKHIAIFKELVELQEKQNQELAEFLHSEILPQLFVSKMDLFRRCKVLLKDKFNQAEIEKDLSGFNSAFEDLRTVMDNLHPSLLKHYGLTKTIQSYARIYSTQNSKTIDFKNNEIIEINKFSHIDQVHIFHLFKAILDLFFKASNAKTITILISSDPQYWMLDFNAELQSSLEKSNTKEFDSSFHIVEARLALINGHITSDSNWSNNIYVLIPFEK